MTTSASNERPRAMGAPSALNAQLRPSNTRSSLPPNWFTYTTGTAMLQRHAAQHLLAPRCLPAENGDADRFTTASAPAPTSSSIGSWW